ncbi:MAG: rhodanese-like domain-containing protein [Burkholderiales bacterium]
MTELGETAVARVTAPVLRAMLNDGGEMALIDVREEGVFSRGHLFAAGCIALSVLELEIGRLVPRKGVRVVLCDDDESLAMRAAGTLRCFGYGDVRILAGGVPQWKSAGFEVFSGVNVPSKAFGEFIEHHCATPSLAPEELKKRIDAGENLVILDSRPMVEFTGTNIPGALDCPGAELAYRVREVAPDPRTTVVVNCAGRTRSIIGAQSLINARIPNPVIALRNGTMGWHLAGLPLEHGNTRMAPAPGAAALRGARESAALVARRFAITKIDWAALTRMRTETAARTLYCLDVRDPSEFATGTLPGFANAPGGQLVQATDQYVATRNARLVLADTDGVRAVMTASWLVQMGLVDVAVLDGVGPEQFTEQTSSEPIRSDRVMVRTITATALQERCAAETIAVIDLATSLQFRKEHIPGAWWAIRARLKEGLPCIQASGAIAFTSPDARLAELAAIDTMEWTNREVFVLAGGTNSWRDAGFAMEAGDARMIDPPEDVWYRPYEQKGGAEQAMRDYLSWEVELVEQIKREGITYPTFPPV